MKLKSVYFANYALGLVLIASAPNLSIAQEKTVSSENNFQIIEKDDGFIRLNKTTGETSFCRTVNANLICKMAVEDRNILQNEIADLQRQITGLRSGGKSEDISPAKPPRDVPNQKPENELDKQFSKLDKELGRALDLTRRTMRRFFDAVKGLQRDWDDS